MSETSVTRQHQATGSCHTPTWKYQAHHSLRPPRTYQKGQSHSSVKPLASPTRKLVVPATHQPLHSRAFHKGSHLMPLSSGMKPLESPTPVLGQPNTPAGSGLHHTEGALDVAQRLAGLAPLPALGVQRNEEHAIPERRRGHQPVRLQLPGHRQGTGLIARSGLCVKARSELSIGHGPETGLARQGTVAYKNEEHKARATAQKWGLRTAWVCMQGQGEAKQALHVAACCCQNESAHDCSQ